MKSPAIRLFLVGGAIALVAALYSAPAEAHTCSSACNQIRRACNSVAKATLKVGFAVCDEGRDTCREACAIDNSVCVQACTDANTACVAACGADQTCLDGCAAALAAGPAEGPDCCNAARSTCRQIEKDTRAASRLVCTDSRTTCNETCVSVDGNCVKKWGTTRRRCERQAKDEAVTCKREECTGGTTQRACMRNCRKVMNQKFQICADQEAVMIGTECISP
jgi:hypothetical protein